MAHEVHVFGDSHWRNFFPFLNTGSPGATWEQDGIRTIDMVANELSGATMYGLLNTNSKNGARNRILGDLDRLGGVENVGLVFGEVDVRYPQHHDRYFRPDGSLITCEVLNLLVRYRRFIEEDLIVSRRVRGFIFVYFGFAYPKGPDTLLQPGLPMGDQAFGRAKELERAISSHLSDDVSIVTDRVQHRVKTIMGYRSWVEPMVSQDGVHFLPERIFPEVVLPAMRHAFGLNGRVEFGKRPELPL